MCINADIHSRGYPKSKESYQDNSYYVDVQDSNINSNPIMEFGADEGFENASIEGSLT